MLIEYELDGQRHTLMLDSLKVWLNDGRALELSDDRPPGPDSGLLISPALDHPEAGSPLVLYPLAANMVAVHIGRRSPAE